MTPHFRERLKNGETFEDLMPEAFAACREQRLVALQIVVAQRAGPLAALRPVTVGALADRLGVSRRQVSYWLTQLSLLVAAWLTLAYPDETPLRALGGMFVADKLGDVLKLFAYIAVSLTLFYSRTYLAARGLFRGESRAEERRPDVRR